MTSVARPRVIYTPAPPPPWAHPTPPPPPSMEAANRNRAWNRQQAERIRQAYWRWARATSGTITEDDYHEWADQLREWPDKPGIAECLADLKNRRPPQQHQPPQATFRGASDSEWASIEREWQETYGSSTASPPQIQMSALGYRDVSQKGIYPKADITPSSEINSPGNIPEVDTTFSWESAMERFPDDEQASFVGLKGEDLISFLDDGVAVAHVNLYSNTWRGARNAQQKRRQIRCHVGPLLSAQPTYQRFFATDDYTDDVHDALMQMMRRKKNSLWAVDNQVSRGGWAVITDLPGLPGFTEVPAGDLEKWLDDALEGITPPDENTPGRFRPTRGSRKWDSYPERPDPDQNKWHRIASKRTAQGAPEPESMPALEAHLTANSIDYRKFSGWWRSQCGTGLYTEWPDVASALEYVENLPNRELSKFGYELKAQAAGGDTTAVVGTWERMMQTVAGRKHRR